MSGKKTSTVGRRSNRVNNAPLAVTTRPTTKDVLIEVGELLFGRHGFDGISLREIASAAGQANTNAVQYHFNDKMSFIVAIMEDRVKRIEPFRGELVQPLRKGSRQYSRELLKALWLPTMQIRGSDGTHTFCRYLLQLMLQLNMVLQPLARFYNGAASAKNMSAPDFSYTALAVQLLKENYHNLPSDVLKQRMVSINLMFLATVVEHDNTQLQIKGSVPAEFNIEPLLDIGVAALKIPM
jgi:AcrR family transcriptional regulator